MSNETGVFVHPAAVGGPLDPTKVFDVRLAGASMLAVDSGGTTSVAATPAATTNLAVLNTLTLGSAGGIKLSSTVNGVLLVTNATSADLARIMLGGSTSSFPALKRSTTTVQARLADDSGYTGVDASQYSLGGPQVQRVNEAISVVAAGTAYTLTNTAAAVDFGTTDPILTINAIGTWQIIGYLRIDVNTATLAASQLVTCTLRRINNSPANLRSTTQVMPALSGANASRWVCSEVVYTCANETDQVQWFCSIAVVPSPGTATIAEASIYAYRLY